GQPRPRLLVPHVADRDEVADVPGPGPARLGPGVRAGPARRHDLAQLVPLDRDEPAGQPPRDRDERPRGTLVAERGDQRSEPAPEAGAPAAGGRAGGDGG